MSGTAHAQNAPALISEAVLQMFLRESFFHIDKNACAGVIKKMTVMALGGMSTEREHGEAVAKGCLDPHSLVYPTPWESDEFGFRVPKWTQPDMSEVVEAWISHPIIYVKVKDFFSTRTENELKEKLKEIRDEKIILDLRGNPGGNLESLIESAELFAPYAGAPILVEHFSNGHIQTTAKRRGPYAGHSMAILVDKNTASAAEILTAILKNWGEENVVIIGEPTYRKSTAQMCVLCNELIQVRITIGLVTVGSLERRVDIHGVGIRPELIVPPKNSLNRALRYYGVAPSK